MLLLCVVAEISLPAAAAASVPPPPASALRWSPPRRPGDLLPQL